MRKFRMASLSALLTLGAISLPLLASTTSAAAANPRSTPPIGKQLAELRAAPVVARSSVPESGPPVVGAPLPHGRSLGASGLGFATTGVTGAASKRTTYTYLNAVACPTAQTCVAVGATETDVTNASGELTGGSFSGIVLRSTDGGMQWSTISLPSGHAYLASVACASATRCVAVGATEQLSDHSWNPNGAVVMVTSNGVSWTTASFPSGAGALFAASCPSTSTCVAVGGRRIPGTLTIRPEALVSVDHGERWSRGQLPAINGVLAALACPTTSRCVAAGADPYVAGNEAKSKPVAIISTDHGGSWSSATIANSNGSSGGAVAVACPTASGCVGAGDTFDWCECGTSVPGHYGESWSSANGGATWADHVFATVGGFDVWYSDAISCWSATQCLLAAAGTHNAETAGGVFYPLLLPLSSSNGWAGPGGGTALPTVLQPQWIDGLDCRSSSTCVAVGESYQGGLAIETEQGGRWTSVYPGGSANWTGYAQTAPTGVEYTAVRGTFNVPSISNRKAECPRSIGAAPCFKASLWVGIGGVKNGQNLVQAGIELDMDAGGHVVGPYAWSETLGRATPCGRGSTTGECPFGNLTIRSGDTIEVTIEEVTANHWSITVDDLTTKHDATRKLTYVSDHSSVEAIVERVNGQDNNQGPALTPTTNVVFDPVSYETRGETAWHPFFEAPSEATTYSITMASADDRLTAYATATPSGVNASDNGFQVADGPVAPPIP